MNPENQNWEIVEGDHPIIVTAIHNGHQIRPALARRFLLSAEQRLREEDPYTGTWTVIADSRIVVHRSRFEVDLNRPREKAVYIKPEDAWGLQVWESEPGAELIDASLAFYDQFYAEVFRFFKTVEERFGKFVVLDLHSYNHRREGSDGPPADPRLNPEVNIGTGSMQRERWAVLVDRFIDDLSSYAYRSRHLDVRENVKFRGGNFSKWIHENFPESACALAIEFKKFFMDEWTGSPDSEEMSEIQSALHFTLPGLIGSLKKLGARI